MPDYITIEEAAARLPSVDRVMVVGCSGSGKSTLSQALCARLNLPYVSMDRDFFWLPGWVRRPKEDEIRLIAETVAQERWVFDGSGPSTFHLRLPRTQLVLWIRVSRWLCLWSVIRRGWHHRGKTRPDMAPGCPEQIPDREFLSYIWSFEQKFVPRMIHNFDLYAPAMPIVMLKSRREVRRLLDLVEASS